MARGGELDEFLALEMVCSISSPEGEEKDEWERRRREHTNEWNS
jgi:hypothetical protein